VSSRNGTGPFDTIGAWAKASLDGYAYVEMNGKTPVALHAHKGVS
jgi:hypothetical protein